MYYLILKREKQPMKHLWWQSIGAGNYHLVLLHGWGLNAKVWNCVQKELASQVTLHLVDLPGFGRSHGYGALSLNEMANSVLERAPKKAIWLGWSLGGLVASQAALIHPERVQALVTVASSPCFGARREWPGIRPEVLTNFQQQLNKNFQRTATRFLALQTMGTETVQKDTRALKQAELAFPMPTIEVLNSGLEILKTTDLREALSVLPLPHMRLYGYFDGLVPRKIAPLLDTLWPHSKSLVMAKAAHAPFISHPTQFCAILMRLIQRLD